MTEAEIQAKAKVGDYILYEAHHIATPMAGHIIGFWHNRLHVDMVIWDEIWGHYFVLKDWTEMYDGIFSLQVITKDQYDFFKNIWITK